MPRYIDADELKKFDFDKIFDYKASYEICLGIEAVLMIAEKMPSADVQEVKHGKWIPTTNGNFECSICHSMWNRRFLHDPHCGARMDGGTEHD